jgi:hypothetical protein
MSKRLKNGPTKWILRLPAPEIAYRARSEGEKRDGTWVPEARYRRAQTQFDEIFKGQEFKAMFDIVFAIVQRMGNASNDVQIHLMPFISHEYTFVKYPLVGAEMWHKNRLRQRNSSFPGYDQSMRRAVQKNEYWFMSRWLDTEGRRLHRSDEARSRKRMLEINAHEENEGEGESDNEIESEGDHENEGEGEGDNEIEGEGDNENEGDDEENEVDTAPFEVKMWWPRWSRQ